MKSEANVLSFKQYRQNSAAQSALSVAQAAHSISWVVGCAEAVFTEEGRY
ncbi:MAG: hypothetical protein ACKERG_03325 [Candidatus Hodgkinia cicadicola]